MAEKAKHAFGSLERVDQAIAAGTIDAFDILFVKDANGKPYVGWVDKQGQKVICSEEDEVVFVKDASLPATGEEGKIYVFGTDAYIWNGTEFKNLCKPTDLTDLEADLTELENSLATKASAEEVNAKFEKVESAMDDYLAKRYEVSSKPVGTIVDYRGKEIRIMCPVDTQWSLQQSGENADKNSYYIGIKAYAPSNDVVSFKEDTKKTIEDPTMFTFEGEFAGVDSDGRKYSIIWLPAASYDKATSTWTYYGANSSDNKFVGWYYSVEWYDASGTVVASDCIRINLSNEDCHSMIEPFYVGDAVKAANTYTDEQIEAKLTGISSGVEVVEF